MRTSNRTGKGLYLRRRMAHPMIPKEAIESLGKKGFEPIVDEPMKFQKGKRINKKLMNESIDKRYDRYVEKYNKKFAEYEGDPLKQSMLNATMLKEYEFLLKGPSQKIEGGVYYDFEQGRYSTVRSYNESDIEKIAGGVYAADREVKPLKFLSKSEIREKITDKQKLSIFRSQSGALVSQTGLQMEELPTGEIIPVRERSKYRQKIDEAKRLFNKEQKQHAEAAEAAGLDYLKRSPNMKMNTDANYDLYRSGVASIDVHSRESTYMTKAEIFRENLIKAVIDTYNRFGEICDELVDMIVNMSDANLLLMYVSEGIHIPDIYLEAYEAAALELKATLMHYM